VGPDGTDVAIGSNWLVSSDRGATPLPAAELSASSSDPARPSSSAPWMSASRSIDTVDAAANEPLKASAAESPA
jgi:hypothetical protein